MNWEKKLYKILLTLFAGALILAICGLPVQGFYQQPRMDRLTLFQSGSGGDRVPSGFGMVQRPTLPPQTQPPETLPPVTEPPVTQAPTQPKPTIPEPTVPLPTLPELIDPVIPTRPATFTDRHREFVYTVNGPNCHVKPDVLTLLKKPLDIDLSLAQPTVLIVHTHATESYTKGPGEIFDTYTSFRTQDTDYNMVSIGAELARQLEAAGIRVLHDTTLHDYRAYDVAYDRSKASVQAYMEQYPSIQVVLDLHRDASKNADGTQQTTGIMVNGEKVAQIMPVMGTSNSYDWQSNLSFALKLQAALEMETPGITKGVVMRLGKYNQELLPGALLIEMGSAGNTHQEVMRSVPYLARALISLMKGANV